MPRAVTHKHVLANYMILRYSVNNIMHNHPILSLIYALQLWVKLMKFGGVHKKKKKGDIPLQSTHFMDKRTTSAILELNHKFCLLD